MKITKKLRDVTREEYVEWCRKCKLADCRVCIFDKVNCNIGSIRSWVENKDLYSDKFLDQTIEIEVPDILNKKEKEYLSAVIKPFRDRIKWILKDGEYGYGRQYLWFELEENDCMCLPKFKENTMYKGMENKKRYTLEELGL